jgi:hypothetical protein
VRAGVSVEAAVDFAEAGGIFGELNGFRNRVKVMTRLLATG